MYEGQILINILKAILSSKITEHNNTQLGQDAKDIDWSMRGMNIVKDCLINRIIQLASK
jgi:hypothetical protein